MIFKTNNRKTNHFTRFWKNIDNNLKKCTGQNQWDNYININILKIPIFIRIRMKIDVFKKANHKSSFKI